MNILICFTELAEYFVSCVNEVISQTNATIHLVRWPVNKEAPFKFNNLHPNIIVYERHKYSESELLNLAKEINPNLIMVSGWVDKGYTGIAKFFYKKIPTVLLFDNKWQNTFKQNIASLLSPIMLKNKFSHCFVPGPEQVIFANKLGYKNDQILTGFYSCDYLKFNGFLEKYKNEKAQDFPKKFIFIGRYYDFKGLPELWDAFIELQNEQENEWELWCLGTGDLAPIEHPKIKHFGFVQPQNLFTYLKQTGVFVMPSRIEPWGVVLHEMVAAGFPVICSDKVGSAVSFLVNNKNGFSFEAGNKTDLKESLKKIMKLSNQELINMGIESEALAKKITPALWAKSLCNLIK